MMGTRWEQGDAQNVPVPGDPSYLNYTYDPLKTGVAPPPPDGLPPAPDDLPPAPDGPPRRTFRFPPTRVRYFRWCHRRR